MRACGRSPARRRERLNMCNSEPNLAKRAVESDHLAVKALLVWLIVIAFFNISEATGATTGTRFEISFPAATHPQPITGRLFLMISRVNEPEVRLQSTWFNSPEIVAIDVRQLKADQAAIIDAAALATPLRSLSDLPEGDYYVQAVLNVYTEFYRSDGHVLWLHMDQGEGQQFNKSPGNLYSKVEKLHFDHSGKFELRLTEIIPPIPMPADTQWVKYVRFQSKLLTQFWGHPIYLGAVVLLPRDYASRPDLHYPVIYCQPEHFRSSPPFEFSTDRPGKSASDSQAHERLGYESGYEFYQSWSADHFPRVIAISVQTPTPLSDWSGGVDSANNGPYGQAITTELLPYLEQRFRIIRQSFARVLTGKASGGRAALALQLLHPELFGGAWIFRPWPFDFQQYFGLNIYDSGNAYTLKPTDLPEFGRNPSNWLSVERGYARTTNGTPFVSFRQAGQQDAVMAGMAAGDPIGADDAILGPTDENGYPKALWDRRTGQIDRTVADYWRDHGDLAHYAQKHWQRIGAALVGKLHFYVDDLDEFYRNYGVHRLDEFLNSTPNSGPVGAFSYSYGTLHQGGWQPVTNGELIRMMADDIVKTAPEKADMTWWRN